MKPAATNSRVSAYENSFLSIALSSEKVLNTSFKHLRGEIIFMGLHSCDNKMILEKFTQQVTERMKISRPAISHHLKILRQANLVDCVRKGKERFYSLSRGFRLWVFVSLDYPVPFFVI
jgi:DNA-binding transcriptional ArsR family regulator